VQYFSSSSCHHDTIWRPTRRPGLGELLLTTAGARFIGYGIGMFFAARAPWRNLARIDTMIATLAVDLVATLAAVVDGVLPLRRAAPHSGIARALHRHPRLGTINGTYESPFAEGLTQRT
jgi:hypothetical protein